MKHPVHDWIHSRLNSTQVYWNTYWV